MAEPQQYQIAWRACAVALGIKPSEVGNAQFIGWAAKQAQALREHLGIGHAPLPPRLWREHLAKIELTGSEG